MKIYVGNLPYSMKNHELKSLFKEYGAVKTAEVVIDKFSGQSKGFGFVDMPDKSSAAAAIAGLNRHEIQGRPLRVNAHHAAKPREDRSSRTNRKW